MKAKKYVKMVVLIFVKTTSWVGYALTVEWASNRMIPKMIHRMAIVQNDGLKEEENRSAGLRMRHST